MACLLQTLKMALTILMYRLSSLVLLTAPPFLFLGRIMKKEGWCVGLKFQSPSSSKFQLELLHENRVSTEPIIQQIYKYQTPARIHMSNGMGVQRVHKLQQRGHTVHSKEDNDQTIAFKQAERKLFTFSSLAHPIRLRAFFLISQEPGIPFGKVAKKLAVKESPSSAPLIAYH